MNLLGYSWLRLESGMEFHHSHTLYELHAIWGWPDPDDTWVTLEEVR